MNRNQKLVLLLGAIILGFLAVCPPWLHIYDYRDSHMTIRASHAPAWSNGPLLNPPSGAVAGRPLRFWRTEIDSSRLLLEGVAVAALTFAGVVLFSLVGVPLKIERAHSLPLPTPRPEVTEQPHQADGLLTPTGTLQSAAPASQAWRNLSVIGTLNSVLVAILAFAFFRYVGLHGVIPFGVAALVWVALVRTATAKARHVSGALALQVGQVAWMLAALLVLNFGDRVQTYGDEGKPIQMGVSARRTQTYDDYGKPIPMGPTRGDAAITSSIRAIDYVVPIGGVIWFVARPSLAPLLALILFQLVSVAFNVSVFTSLNVGTDLHKALSVHVALRVGSLWLMGSSIWNGELSRIPR